ARLRPCGWQASADGPPGRPKINGRKDQYRNRDRPFLLVFVFAVYLCHEPQKLLFYLFAIAPVLPAEETSEFPLLVMKRKWRVHVRVFDRDGLVVKLVVGHE